MTHLITPRGHVSDCSNFCLYLFAGLASMEHGRAKLTLPICTKLWGPDLDPSRASQLSRFKKADKKKFLLRVLKFARVVDSFSYL